MLYKTSGKYLILPALTKVRHIDGSLPVRLHVEVQVLHELQIVHVQLLTNMALECHIGLELLAHHGVLRGRSHLLQFVVVLLAHLAGQSSIVIALHGDQFLSHLDPLVHGLVNGVTNLGWWMRIPENQKVSSCPTSGSAALFDATCPPLGGRTGELLGLSPPAARQSENGLAATLG